MAKICYEPQKFQPKTMKIIELANEIVEEYEAMGFQLTLRQLYYQFVARNVLKNTLNSYKGLSAHISNARYAGLIDWDSLEDRGRVLRSRAHWNSPAEILATTAKAFSMDRWKDQKFRPELWVEKEALIGVIEPMAEKWDMAAFPCKGYSSSTAMHEAAQRLISYRKAGQQPVVLYLGDHDPSGQDMTRDITERLDKFKAGAVVMRLALNMDQVRHYNLPPQVAKDNDARSKRYIKQHGASSWELDALTPDILSELIETAASSLYDSQKWQKVAAEEREHRQKLLDLSENWNKGTRER